MRTAERIYNEVKHLPEEMTNQVLDFVLFLEQRHKLGVSGQKSQSGALAELLSHPFSPKGDGLPIKREEIYDRDCLR